MSEYSWPPAADDFGDRVRNAWPTTVAALPVGTTVTGVVIGRQPFGVFVTIDGIPDAAGLAEVIGFPPTIRLPMIGAHVSGEVTAHADHNHQVRLRLTAASTRETPWRQQRLTRHAGSERQVIMTESAKALSGLRWLAIEGASGHQVGSDRLITAGLDALLSGLDSPSLAQLAGLARREEPEAPELFLRVLDELGLAPELPTNRPQALWAMAHWWADQIVNGEIDPLAGADLIWWRVAAELGYPDQLRAIVAGAVNGEDWNEDWPVPVEQIKNDIAQAARGFQADQPAGR